MDHTKAQPSKNTTLPLSEKSSVIHTNDDTDPNINLDDDIAITQHEAVNMVQDDCDIANAGDGEHAEQLNLSSQCMDIDKKEEGHTGNQDLEGPTLRDIMYFRDHLLEMVEELRIRRVAERGYDEQITAMRKDNQELQEINAGILSQLADMESTHTTIIAETEKSHQAMLTAAKKIEEKKVNVAENLEKENEALKMEIQTFKVKEYEKEKQVTDLERSLQLLSSNKDWGMKQLVTIEETCHQLTSKLEHIEERRLKLEANVEKATELNKSLTLVNLHQECMTEELRQENKELQSLLRETRVQKHKEPVEDNQKLTQAELTVEKLNQQHKLLCTEIGDLKQDLEKADIKHKVDAKLLEECHIVLSKQVDCGEGQTVQIKQLEDNLNALQDKHTSLEELHRETDNKLKEKEELCNQLRKTLEVKENELIDRYTRLNEEYKQLVISHTSLEDHNTKWSDTNLQLTNQIQQLKDEAKKVDQLDALVQTDITPTNNTLVQTDTAHKMEHSTQTYIDIVPNKESQKVSSTTASTQTYTDSSSSPHPENQEVINESLVSPTASVSGELVIESTMEVLKSQELRQSTKSVAGAPNKQSQKLSTTFPVSNEINSEPVGIPTTKDTTTIEGSTNKPFISSSYTDADLSASVETLGTDGADEPQSKIDISNVHDISKKDKANKVMDTVNEDATIIPATPIERINRWHNKEHQREDIGKFNL
ncbi:unnamed protein product [Owenia fusiformis]|uniref:Uncharacterized protein n=1 Tax=Owenia fusiformis TaxID=6347 RepID=A0A8S4N089_OWEFU|nr:unnamed protein product [Owenia fusiformis]